MRRNSVFIRHQASGQKDEYKLEEIISGGGKMKKNKLDVRGYNEKYHLVTAIAGAATTYFCAALIGCTIPECTSAYLCAGIVTFWTTSLRTMRWYNRAFV